MSPELKEKSKQVLACLLFGVLGFIVGAFLMPEKPARVETQETISSKHAESSHEKKNLVRTVYIKTTVTPDAGTVTETSIREEDKGEKTVDVTNDTKKSTVTVSTPSDKPWRAGPMIGATWGIEPGKTPLVVGGEVGFLIPKTPIELNGWVMVPVADPSRGAAGGAITIRW